jgi:uncharacterized protein YjdB
MKTLQKSITGIILGLLLVFSGCEQAQSPTVSGDQAQTFRDAYAATLAKAPDDADLEDFADEVNAALLTWEQLSPAIQQALAAEKATLDALATKLGYLIEKSTVFYISPDGDDTSGDGSIENPWFSLNRAETAVSPGGTVYIRGGVYQILETVTETHNTGSTAIDYVFHMTKSGRPTAPINYFAYPGDERPVFDMSQVKPLDVRVYVLVVEGSYLHFKGFDIAKTQVNVSNTAGTTQSECVLNYGGNNNIYEELVMRDGMAIGFYITAGSNNLILNCDAYNNWDYLSDNGSGGDTDGFGAHLSSTGYTGNIFRGCRAWLNSDDGFDSISCSAAITVENCWSFYNGYKLVSGQYQNSSGSGVGFKIGGFGNNDAVNPVSPTPRHTIQFSLAALNRGQGFYANHHWGGNDWLNNTAYQNRQNFNMWGRKDGEGRAGYDHRLFNNLSYKPREAGNYIVSLPPEENQSSNNSFDLGLELSDADFVSVFDWTELSASRKADGSLPELNFLKPAATSKIIDRGSDIGFQYYGAAPDLGCMEIQGGTAVIPVSGIGLDKETLLLTGSGKQETLSAVIAPDNAVNKAVRWESNNTAVAYVLSNGLNATVTSKGMGTATITVTTEDGGLSASCAVTVTSVPVTGVSLSHATLSIAQGDSAALTATVSPPDATDPTLVWESDSSNVSISGAGSQVTINGISSGSATVTVKTQDGNLTDTCTVTVTAPIPVSGISLDKTALSMLPGTTATLTAAISPDNAANKNVAWESSNTDVATVVGSGLTATISSIAPGNTIITVSADDGRFTAQCAVTVTDPNAHTLVVRNRKSGTLNSGTTADTSALLTWTGPIWTQTDSPLAVTNAETTGNIGGLMADATLVYMPVPLSGVFTWKAKLTLSPGGSTASTKGVFFGVYADPAKTPASDSDCFNIAGIRHATSTDIKSYFTSNRPAMRPENTTGAPENKLPIETEYTFEISWNGTNAWSLKITAAEIVYSWNINAGSGANNINAALTASGGSYYPGFYVGGATIAISEISLTTTQVEQSGTPTATATTVAKTAATQTTAAFTLTSSNTGTWKVYSAATGGSALTDVSASFAAPTLTLTATGADLAAGDYWVTVTETSKTESPRLKLTLSAYVPPGQEQSGAPTATATTVVKTASPQTAVAFTLTSSNTGTWKVYSAATGGSALTDVSASFAVPTLTLTATGADLAAGDYWVTVTETDKTESSRLKLTVAEPLKLLIVRNMAASPVGSTTANNDNFITMDASNSWTGSTTLVNGDSGGYGSNTVTKATLAYIPSPASGKFTWTAKIALSGGSGSSDGLIFGVFVDLPAALPEAASSSNPIYFAGARHLFSGTVRGYYTRADTNPMGTTGLNNAGNTIGDSNVYTYKVQWNGTKYSITITKPDSNELTTEVTTGSTSVASGLFDSAQGRYPGFGITNGTATITEVSLTFDD